MSFLQRLRSLEQRRPAGVVVHILECEGQPPAIIVQPGGARFTSYEAYRAAYPPERVLSERTVRIHYDDVPLPPAGLVASWLRPEV